MTERNEMATPTKARTMPPKKLQPSKPPLLPASGSTGVTGVVMLGVTDVDVTVVVVVIVVLVVGASVVVVVVVLVVLEDEVFWVDVVGGGNVVVVLEESGVVALSGSNPLSGGTMVVKSSMGSFSPSTKPSPLSSMGVTSTFSTLEMSASGAFSVGVSGRARAEQAIRRRARIVRWVSMLRFSPQ